MSRKMRFWLLLALLSALVLSLAFPSITYAGGWAVVTLDALPENVVAGKPYELGFTARQHGQTPWIVDQIQISAAHTETGERVTFTALPDGNPGHYQAELLFTQPGSWNWGIGSGLYPDVQPMPAIDVLGEASNASTTTGNNQAAIPPSRLFGLVSLLGLALGVFIVVRSRKRLNIAWAAVAVVVLISGLAFVLLSSAKAGTEESIPNTGTGADQFKTSLARTGQDLFLAKGCVVCHVNNRAIEQSEQYSVNSGPNLTNYSKDPEYLSSFLLSPQSVKIGTDMPTLGLKESEIEALIAFLNE